MRVSSYDPDDPSQSGNVAGGGGTTVGGLQSGGYVAPKTLGNQRKFMPGSQSNKVSTISQNYNEKTMLLSSDDEYQ